MLKRFMHWILPLVVLVLIATYFVLSPALATPHAAAPSTPFHITAPKGPALTMRWRPFYLM